MLVDIAMGPDNKTTSSADRVTIVNVTMVKCCVSIVVLGVGVLFLCATVSNLTKRSSTLLLVAYMTVGVILSGMLPWADLTELVLQRDQKDDYTDNFNGNIFLTWIREIAKHWQFQAVALLAVERFCFIAISSVHEKYFTADKISGLLGSCLTFIMVLETTKTLKAAHDGGRNLSIIWGTFPMYVFYTLVVFACYAGLIQKLMHKRNNIMKAPKLSSGKRIKLRLYGREINYTLLIGSTLSLVLLGNIFCTMSQIYLSSSANCVSVLSCVMFFVTANQSGGANLSNSSC